MQQRTKEKVLIIKLGYSETLDRRQSLTTSLGDVLRTTFILHYFKEQDIYWLIDKKAKPLLENNKYIKKILFYSSVILGGLKKETFDIIINLEKLPQIYTFVNSLIARERFGFWPNGFGSNNNSFEGSRELIDITQDIENRKKNKHYWQEILAGAVGKQWSGEKYILGYKPSSKIKYDIGFNWTTSNKWLNKAWPKAYWDKLKSLIKDRYSISWQQGHNNLYDYIEWVNSCRLIVTADTLGLHLSLALEKRVIALFGPTSPYELYLYNCGSYLLPESPYRCLPCFMPTCNKKKQCMEYILPVKVKERIEDEFERNISTR
jgi:heptosyltransferase-2